MTVDELRSLRDSIPLRRSEIERLAGFHGHFLRDLLAGRRGDVVPAWAEARIRDAIRDYAAMASMFTDGGEEAE